MLCYVMKHLFSLNCRRQRTLGWHGTMRCKGRCRVLDSHANQVFNIVSRNYTTNPKVDFNLSNVINTRGNVYKMQLTHMHYNLHKHLFSNME